MWLRDTTLVPDLPADIENKFQAMFDEDPVNYPIDETEEDDLRLKTGVYTGACHDETAKERLETGGIRAAGI